MNDRLDGLPWAVVVVRRDEDVAPKQASVLEAVLSATELERARTIATSGGRASFVIGRALLRVTLSDFGFGDPVRIALGVTGHGKPVLAGPASDRRMDFNLSHSGRLVVLGLSTVAEVGVDVQTTVGFDARIAARVLDSAERRLLESLPEQERGGAFTQMWTIKEALLKARGDRLASIRKVSASLEDQGTWESASWWALDTRTTARAAVALCSVDYGRGHVLHVSFRELMERCRAAGDATSRRRP